MEYLLKKEKRAKLAIDDRKRLENVIEELKGWRCTCGFRNRPNNTICGGQGTKLGCKLPKEQAENGVIIADEWLCRSCGFRNRAMNQICGGVSGSVGCKKPRIDVPTFAGGLPITEAEAIWTCPECQFKNRAQNLVCGGGGKKGCKTPKPRDMEANAAVSTEEALQAAATSAMYQQLAAFQTALVLQQIAAGQMVPTAPDGTIAPEALQLAAGPVLGTGAAAGAAAPGALPDIPGDLWQCTCGFVNLGHHDVCRAQGCEQHKPEPGASELAAAAHAAAAAAAAASSATPIEVDVQEEAALQGSAAAGAVAPAVSSSQSAPDGFWASSCGYMNSDLYQFSGNSGGRAPNPADAGAKPAKAWEDDDDDSSVEVVGFWSCPCGYRNSELYNICGNKGCRAPKPQSMPLPPPPLPAHPAAASMPQVWGQPPEEEDSDEDAAHGGPWACACGFENDGDSIECKFCGMPQHMEEEPELGKPGVYSKPLPVGVNWDAARIQLWINPPDPSANGDYLAPKPVEDKTSRSGGRHRFT